MPDFTPLRYWAQAQPVLRCPTCQADLSIESAEWDRHWNESEEYWEGPEDLAALSCPNGHGFWLEAGRLWPR